METPKRDVIENINSSVGSSNRSDVNKIVWSTIDPDVYQAVWNSVSCDVYSAVEVNVGYLIQHLMITKDVDESIM